MKKKILLTVSVSILLLSLSILGTLLVIRVYASTTHHVYPGQSIQGAINSAQPGDIIYVHNGTYYEHVVVNRVLSLIGENRRTTVIDGSGTGNVIDITFHSVNVNGFTIRNGTNGIFINGAPYNIISGNIVTENQNGIHLFTTCPCHCPCKNTIRNNTIKNNGIGIHLEKYSTDNAICHNNFINNTVQANVTAGYVNIWNDGYPSGGNYWSDHVCVGNPSNGSQPYIVDADNIDRYPFQDPNSWVISGDVNGDGIVDIFDLVYVGIHYGAERGKPPPPDTQPYEPKADINGDDIIDLFDIVIIGIHYGETYP